MKNILSLVVAGIIGGFIAYGIADFAADKNDTVIPQQYLNARSVLTSERSVSPFPPDFVSASHEATPAVVHIKSEESRRKAQERYENQKRNRRANPFQDFFGFDMGGGDLFDSWGRGFYQQKGSGSGVILSKDGYIVTNNHVVGFADDILVTLDDGREFNAKKVGTDPDTDLAVLKIEGSSLPHLQYGNSDNVKVGEWVLAVGNPFDYLRSTVTAGIVSAKGRDIDIIKGENAHEEFIQTDAAVNPGNSGGALVDTNGKLIGINTAIATPTGVYAGYSFAIPSNLVKTIVKDIIANPDPEPTVADRMQNEKARLGLQVNNVDELIKNGEDVGHEYGVFVDEVMNGSSAQFAGILPGDIIVRLGKTEIKNFDDLVKALENINIGDTKNVEVIRDNTRKTIPVKFRRGI